MIDKNLRISVEVKELKETLTIGVGGEVILLDLRANWHDLTIDLGRYLFRVIHGREFLRPDTQSAQSCSPDVG